MTLLDMDFSSTLEAGCQDSRRPFSLAPHRSGLGDLYLRCTNDQC